MPAKIHPFPDVRIQPTGIYKYLVTWDTTYTFETEVFASDPIAAIEAVERGVRNNLTAYRNDGRIYEVRIAPGEEPEKDGQHGPERAEDGSAGEVHPTSGEYIG